MVIPHRNAAGAYIGKDRYCNRVYIGRFSEEQFDLMVGLSRINATKGVGGEFEALAAPKAAEGNPVQGENQS